MADKVSDDRGALDVVETEAIQDKDFGDAFNQAISTEPAELNPADEKAMVEDETNPPVDETKPVIDETKPLVDETKPVETKPDASVQQPGESDEKYEQRYRTLQGIHRHDRETWNLR